MTQPDILPTVPPDAGLARPEPQAKRADQIALAFLLACGLLAAPLLLAARLPRGALVVTAVALLAVFTARGLLTRSFLPRTAVDWPNVLLLLLLPVGLWASTDRSVSWPVIYKVIAGFAIFYSLAGLAGSRWVRTLPWLTLAGSVSLALVVLFGTNWATAKLPWMPAAMYDLLPTVLLPGRTQGFHPNVAGGALAYLLLPAVAMALWSRRRLLQALAALTALLLALALLLSQSRGAWLGVAAGLLLMPALPYRRWRVGAAALLALTLVLSLVLGPERLQDLLFPAVVAEEAAINTLPGRLELWTRAVTMLRDFGVTGVGPGQFEQMTLVLYPPFFTGLQGNFFHAHNLYLQAAIDFGVLGLMALLALLLGVGAAIVAATRRWPAVRAVDRSMAALAVGVFGSLLALVVHGLVDAPQVASPSYGLLFALFGTAMAISSQLITSQRADTTVVPSD